MRLSSKILLSIIFSVSVALFVHQFFLIQILASNFTQIENNELTSKIQRAQGSIERQVTFLERKVADWARWDDTLEFVSGTPNGYVESNISYTTFIDLAIDCLAYFDEQRKPLITLCTDPATKSLVTPDNEMVADMARLSRDVVEQDRIDISGLSRLGSNNFMLSVQRVTDTDVKIQSTATLMFAARMDEALEQEISQLADVDITISPPPDELKHSSSWLDYSNQSIARAYFTIDGIDGYPLALAEIRHPRKIQQISRETRLLNFILTALVGTALAIGSMYYARNIVIKRITRLRDHALEMTSSGKLHANFRDAGRDEISELARAYSDLLEKISSTQEELESARERSELANEAKSEFLANMSHEIRTPMTAIMGYTELLKEGGLDQNEAGEYLDIVMKNSELLLSLINDILDLSKIESGKISFTSMEINLPELVNDILSLMNVKLINKPVTLSQEYKTPVPEKIVTDPLRLRQILINLIGNAIKFTPSGRISIVLSYLEGGSGLLLIEISDTGIGIAGEDLDKIFESFEQASATGITHEGTGLGLPIALRLARELGGEITVRSEPGKGSSFVLEIDAGITKKPKMLDVPPEFSSAPERKTVLEVTTARLDGCVLLVDDNEVNRIYISKLLKSFGLQVIEAVNGKEALELVDQEELGINLVFMDMEMPVMDGYTATERIRSLGNRIPVIALTANIMIQDKEHCIEAGCDDFLGKPVKKVDLLSVCRKYLSPGE